MDRISRFAAFCSVGAMDKILLVDDSQNERAAIKSTLQHLFNEFIEADNGLTAIKAFVEEKPGFVITDVEMPSINGFRFISTIRGMEDGKDVPIIMLSGTKNSLKSKLTGFNVGASDFILKPFDADELVARVKALLNVKHLLNELKEKNALLEKLATIDELTSLYNRRHFFEAVREQFALGQRYKFRAAFMLMDIDHFKEINDTHGHMAGDEILKKLGRLLNACKREGELLARFGGEEFIMCLFNTDVDNALLAAERFRNLIRTFDFSSPNCPSIKISVSIGVAVCPDDKVSVDELIKASDSALYKAKLDGRDRVVLYDWAKHPSN